MQNDTVNLSVILDGNNSSEDLTDFKNNNKKLISKNKRRIVKSFESSDSNDNISIPMNKVIFFFFFNSFSKIISFTLTEAKSDYNETELT